jgi:5-hydroxyisourate hydrolase
LITTHVLDTAAGRPGSNISIELERDVDGTWQLVGSGATDDEGRLRTLTPEGPVAKGKYRIRFQTGDFFPDGFFPVVEIQFTVRDGNQHYHVPLLLSPYGFSTYRGS